MTASGNIGQSSLRPLAVIGNVNVDLIVGPVAPWPTAGTEISVDHDELRVGYPELITAAEIPVVDTSCLALLELARSVHQHGYKVALTGEGADEWLAGYLWFKANKAIGFLDAVPGLPVGGALRTLLLKATGQPTFPLSQYKATQKLLGGPNGPGAPDGR